MSVYVDAARNVFTPYSGARPMVCCHMLADTIGELHEMADRLGLKRSWFQSGSTPHYDLSRSKRKEAIEKGAIEITRRQIVEIIRAYREGRPVDSNRMPGEGQLDLF
jgi:hypothetical protein